MALKAACLLTLPPATSRCMRTPTAEGADDYRIPGFPYLFDPTRPFNGRQPNSSLRTDGGSIGASSIFDQGFIGAAITQNNALYRIPGIDGEDHRTRIDARETKFTSKGEYRPMRAASTRCGSGTATPTTSTTRSGLRIRSIATTDGVRQTFTNKEHEGRVEVQLLPFDLRFASLTTALGMQAGQQKLDAPGDVPGPLSGLFSTER